MEEQCLIDKSTRIEETEIEQVTVTKRQMFDVVVLFV